MKRSGKLRRSPLSRGSKGLKRSKKLRQDADSKYWRAVAKRLAAAGVKGIDPTKPMPWHVHQFAYKPLRKKKLAKVGARAKREEPQLREFRRVIRERCGCNAAGIGFCEGCGERRRIDAHHRVSRARAPGESWLHDPHVNGLGLCARCHREEHGG